MKANRQEAIERLVRNYNAQALIVGETDITLEQYLKGIHCTQDEIKYALEYYKRLTKPLGGKNG